ncbi:MAG: MFS transporter [Rhizomicrobium sp.]
MQSIEDDRLIRRAVRRIMPLATLCFVAAVIDKSNIGFAKLQMAQDLGMSEAVFGLGASLFFVAFLLFEVPSALAAHRFGARAWVARIMASWGVTTLLLAFAASVSVFYGLRFALGVAEAGLYPTLLYYLTLWFPQSYQARVAGILTLGSAIGNGSGALLSGALLDLNGVLGFAGWQWIFLVTGILPLLLTPLVLRFLPDTPAQATFLSAAERARLAALVAADRPQESGERHALSALADLRVLGYSAVYALLGIALFGVIYWTPTAIRGFAVTGTMNGLLSAAPWAVACVMLLTIPARLQTRGAVLRALIGTAAVGTLCFFVAASFAAPAWRYAALVAGTPCISLAIGLFWALPVRLFAGARAAAVIAAINVFGSLGGFIAQNLMPAAASWGGGPAFAMWVPCGCLAVVSVSAAWVALSAAAAPVSTSSKPT